jgi:hypothetical protein
MSFLKKLGQKLSDALAARVRVADATSFHDPVALRTSWLPLKRGGSNFHTHRLVETEAGSLAVKPTVKLWLFAMAFLIPGTIMTLLAVVQLNLALLFGLPFLLVGVGLLWPRKKSFDGSMRQVTLGGTVLPFASIHAVQIIAEWVSSDDSDYLSYELNLVRTDGSRVNVFDHGHLGHVQEDARAISRCIGCPLWDATLAPQLPPDQARAVVEQALVELQKGR